IILDEPINGMENHGVDDIRKLLLGLNEYGNLILIISHNREDINLLCDRVYEMDMGVLTRVRQK
ncbi:MAG: multidrug ABC transporter ATP-binding protein, partial [Lachnospiraceae bacterium]|nr:multidrug ABC transporter ATP-binding protein [Lachnospiraceae bacterium]